MKLKVVIEIEAPEGATHYSGYASEITEYFKCVKYGVVGDHWFYFNRNDGWRFVGHDKPWFVKSLSDIILE